MLANQEKQIRREKWFTTVLWLYIVLLTTGLMTGSGVLTHVAQLVVAIPRFPRES